MFYINVVKICFMISYLVFNLNTAQFISNKTDYLFPKKNVNPGNDFIMISLLRI